MASLEVDQDAWAGAGRLGAFSWLKAVFQQQPISHSHLPSFESMLLCRHQKGNFSIDHALINC